MADAKQAMNYEIYIQPLTSQKVGQPTVAAGYGIRPNTFGTVADPTAIYARKTDNQSKFQLFLIELDY